MDIIIRDASEGDIAEMADLLRSLFEREEDFVPDRGKQVRGLARLLDSDAVVLCAGIGGNVVGMATMQTIVSTAMGSLSGLVEDVVVKAGYRGRGIGRRLLEELAARAAGAGCLRLQLVADRDNSPAHGFYRRMGWKKTNLEAWHLMLGSAGE